MTAEEFEKQYAARSGITVQQLRELGRIVAPCHWHLKTCFWYPHSYWGIMEQKQPAMPYIGNDIRENRGPCIGNDPLCPCQDGDMCHYRGPNAWPIPGEVKQ